MGFKEWFGADWFMRFRASRHAANEPRVTPENDHPPTFDAVTGFANGRKVQCILLFLCRQFHSSQERKMVATWEEMDAADLDIWARDYCAHHYIKWWKCVQESKPFANL